MSVGDEGRQGGTESGRPEEQHQAGSKPLARQRGGHTAPSCLQL